MNIVGQASVVNGFTGTQLTDIVELDGLYRSLTVNKDILLVSGSPDSFGSISYIDQRFYQIPEPGTLAIAGLGLLCLASTHRRRKA